MIDRDHKLPLARQAKAVGISRGSIYYRPRPVGEAGLGQKWLRKSEQWDKWNRCLIEGMIVLSETGARDEQTTPP